MLQNLSSGIEAGRKRLEAEKERGRAHLNFCANIYDMQRREGRCFVHEHPQKACSWKETSIQTIAENDFVLKAEACMCAFGMFSRDETGEAPVKKPTTSMTNSIELHKVLSRACSRCVRHVHLVSGGAAAAQVYPKALCRAICQGIVRQAQADAQELMSIDCTGDIEINNLEHDANDWMQYWDDLSGRQLDMNLTREARAEEIREVYRMGVYVKVSLDECIRETGKMPVGTRWVDVNKGDTLNPKVRSRLVAQEIAVSKQPELFAATPPNECIRYLVSCAASSQWVPDPRISASARACRGWTTGSTERSRCHRTLRPKSTSTQLVTSATRTRASSFWRVRR